MERPKSSKYKDKKLNTDTGDKSENNKKYSIFLPNIKNETNIYIKYKINFEIEEENIINEQLYLLQNEWDELGISDEYKNSFINKLRDIPKIGKKDVIIQEKNSLKKFRNSLNFFFLLRND